MRHVSYFDYNATTALDKGVFEAMRPLLEENYGNPSSIHSIGRRARGWLDEARTRTAELWRCKPHEVVFTSGGTESNNLAILGTARLLKSRGTHLIASPIEHPAVLESVQSLEKSEGLAVTWLPVDSWGRIDPEAVRASIRRDTILVTVMAANNETGVIQPVAEIGRVCRSAGVLFHTDAVQWFGKEPFESIHQFEADLVSVCGHKFHGPKGAGALFIKSPTHPFPLILGGPQENERRAGTENLASIAGLVAAMERFWKPPVFHPQRMSSIQDSIRQCLNRIPNIRVWTPEKGSLLNTLSFSAVGTDSLGMLAALDLEGFCASSGSACSAGSLTPSHVLRALGANDELAHGLVRFSWGRETTLEEVESLIGRLPSIVDQVRDVQGGVNKS